MGRKMKFGIDKRLLFCYNHLALRKTEYVSRGLEVDLQTAEYGEMAELVEGARLEIV